MDDFFTLSGRLDPVLAAEILDLVAVQAEPPGGFCLDPAGLGDGIRQKLAFEVFDGFGEGERTRRAGPLGGALPQGLSLSSTGTISGTPTLAGKSTFTVRAVDSGSSMARQEPSAAIEPPRPPQRVTMNVPKFEDNPTNVTPPQS